VKDFLPTSSAPFLLASSSHSGLIPFLKILNASIDLPSTSEIRYNSKNKYQYGKKAGGKEMH